MFWEILLSLGVIDISQRRGRAILSHNQIYRLTTNDGNDGNDSTREKSSPRAPRRPDSRGKGYGEQELSRCTLICFIDNNGNDGNDGNDGSVTVPSLPSLPLSHMNHFIVHLANSTARPVPHILSPVSLTALQRADMVFQSTVITVITVNQIRDDCYSE